MIKYSPKNRTSIVDRSLSRRRKPEGYNAPVRGSRLKWMTIFPRGARTPMKPSSVRIQSSAVHERPFGPFAKLNVTPNAEMISNCPSTVGRGEPGLTAWTIRGMSWKSMSSL